MGPTWANFNGTYLGPIKNTLTEMHGKHLGLAYAWATHGHIEWGPRGQTMLALLGGPIKTHLSYTWHISGLKFYLLWGYMVRMFTWLLSVTHMGCPYEFLGLIWVLHCHPVTFRTSANAANPAWLPLLA